MQQRGAAENKSVEKFVLEPKNLHAARGLLCDRVKQQDVFFMLPNFAKQDSRNATSNCNAVWEDREFFYVSLEKFNPKDACAVLHSYFFAEVLLICMRGYFLTCWPTLSKKSVHLWPRSCRAVVFVCFGQLCTGLYTFNH